MTCWTPHCTVVTPQLCPAAAPLTLAVEIPASSELGSPPVSGGGGVDIAGHNLLAGRDVYRGNAGVGVGRREAPHVTTVGNTGVREETGGWVAASQATAHTGRLGDEAVHLVAVHLQHPHRSPHLGLGHLLLVPGLAVDQKPLHHRPLAQQPGRQLGGAGPAEI